MALADHWFLESRPIANRGHSATGLPRKRLRPPASLSEIYILADDNILLYTSLLFPGEELDCYHQVPYVDKKAKLAIQSNLNQSAVPK